VAPLLLFWRLVFAGEVLFWGVPLTQFYPWHTLINQALATGHWPLWTDLLGNGAPLLANHQSALFYPPNLIFRLLPVEHALGYSVVLHVIGAGLAALYWGRTLGLRWLGRTVLALSYALGGYVVGRTQFITMVAAYAWIPLLLALTERLVRRQRALDVVWLGGALALQFLAGHAQTWFYSLVLVVAFACYRLVFCLNPAFAGGRSGISRQLAADSRIVGSARTFGVGKGMALLTLAVLLGLCLSAIQLLPTAELALNSQRSEGAERGFAMTYSYWPWRLLTLLAPDLYGNPALGNYVGYATYWEDHAYIGLLPLIFALTAVVGCVSAAIRRARTCAASRSSGCSSGATGHVPPDSKSGGSGTPESRTDPSSGVHPLGNTLGDESFERHEPSLSVLPFFALLLPAAIVLAMGNHTPVFPLVFEQVPGFGLFQAPARMMLWFAVAAGTLAGSGADGFRLTYRKQYVLRLAAAGSVAMLVVALAMERAGIVGDRVHGAALIRLAVLLGLACLLLLLRGRERGDLDTRVVTSPLPCAAWCGLVAALVSADLLIAAMPLTPTLPDDVYRSEGAGNRVACAATSESRLHVDLEYQYRLSFQHFFRFSTFGPRSPGFWSDLRGSLLPNLNAVDGIRSTGNNEPLVVGRWRTLVEQTRRAGPAAVQQLLQLMNVGVVLTNQPAADWEPVASVHDLYRLPDPLPRAWIVYNAETIANAGQLLSRLTAQGFDARRTVLIETTDEPHPLTPSPPSGDGASPGQPTREVGVDRPVSLHEEWNRRTIRLTAARAGYLVLAYTAYPGWHAMVDGRSSPLLRADYALMAVPVESGSHEIVLVYRPATFHWGAMISGLAVLVIVAVCAWGWRRTHK
jgi:hypothetical protein